MRLLAMFALIVSIVGTPIPSRAADVLVVTVSTPEGTAIASAVVVSDGIAAVPDGDGRFIVVSGSTVSVGAPAYQGLELEWDGGAARVDVVLQPAAVFSVHVTGTQAGSDSLWSSLLASISSSSINSVMIDMKDESGRVFSKTPSGRGDELGSTDEMFDLAERTAEAHDEGLYVISRIVTFQDPLVGNSHPSWSAWNTYANTPFSNNGQVFLDPWDVDARRYGLDLAVDACVMGVDEVQFDYVRFPDHAQDGIAFDGPADEAGRKEAINSFLAEASALLHPLGCAVAADIFGFIVSIMGDGGIGQQLEELAEVTDVLSPMVYPSHYSTGWFGFADPNAHPYAVVSGALADGLPRVADSDAVLRPWVQDFWYTSSQVTAQINAADDHGTGWMLWNALGSYQFTAVPSALDADDQASAYGFLALPESGFYDVPDDHPFAADIGWLVDAGITRGCNTYGDEFCPASVVTRAQMAAFLARALSLEAPGGPDRFVDDDDSIFEGDIEAVAEAGITVGCNAPINDEFCPADPISRGQMAALLSRALNLGATPIDFFTDDQDSVFEADINRLAAAGITFGKGDGTYAPTESVTRGQMAAFLKRAFSD